MTDRLPNSIRWRDADAYLFDIDGTLLNSRDGVHYFSFHHAVKEVFGVDSRIDGVPVHGNTDIGILRAVLEREGIGAGAFARKLPEMIASMCAEAERNKADMRPELCPSVRELIETLHGRGKLLGVVSGNLEPIGWLKLEAAGLRRYFAFGSFSDRHERRADIFRHGIAEARRRTAPDAAIYVLGDTPLDIAAAREAAVPIIAVATGIYPPDQLLAHRPDLCVSCCTDLLAI